MMTYHPIKFGRKKISSSVDMVEKVVFDYMSPHCDPELEDSKPIFLHDTLAHDDASPYQVWLQRIQNTQEIFFFSKPWKTLFQILLLLSLLWLLLLAVKR